MKRLKDYLIILATKNNPILGLISVVLDICLSLSEQIAIHLFYIIHILVLGKTRQEAERIYCDKKIAGYEFKKQATEEYKKTIK